MDEKQQFRSYYSDAVDADDDRYDGINNDLGEVLPHPTTRFHQMFSRRKILRRFAFAAFLSILFWVLLGRTFPSTLQRPGTAQDDWQISFAEDKNMSKVPLEAHVMSKCPDARDCLQMLVVPAMERIHDKVDWTLSYIGSLDQTSDAVACKHGPSECLGNTILLCAAKLYPAPVMSLGFANCMIRSWRDIPGRELTEQCALEHGMDFERINECISDEGEGVDLLRNSIQRSLDNNVKISCTVRLADQVRCVRDNHEWKDCEGGSNVGDLVRDVEKLYQERNEWLLVNAS